MKIMTFDVETTGLPVKYAKVDKKSLHLWPQIVQLSWIIYDDVTNKITKYTLEKNKYITTI